MMVVTYRNFTYLLMSCLIVSASALYAQEEEPREYQPEEYVSFNQEIMLDDALEIINQLSTKYENKIIVDPTERKQKIGVTVDNMHWKRALEYILRSNMLSYVERDRYFEITGLGTGTETKATEEKIKLDTREIEIKAVFFEADQQTLSEVGVDWSTLKDGKVQLRVESNAASAIAENIFSAKGQVKFGSWDVFALIRAFVNANKGQIIATPQIRIMEGEEGKIKVGKNFFLTTRDFAGNTRYSEYESGIILRVIPKIIVENKLSFIHLDILAEKSDVVPGAINVIKKITEGKTQVLMINGEETAIAGLFSNEQTSMRKGVPLLKDLPWWFFGLRYLFGYNSQQMIRKELIILIEAQIVPSIIDRMKYQIQKRDFLNERKKEFNERLKDFKQK